MTHSVNHSNVLNPTQVESTECATNGLRLVFSKMQQVISYDTKSFKKFMRPFRIIPISARSQWQKSHYTIQFTNVLLKRLNVLQDAFESCPTLQKEFRIYRNQLANELGQKLGN